LHFPFQELNQTPKGLRYPLKHLQQKVKIVLESSQPQTFTHPPIKINPENLRADICLRLLARFRAMSGLFAVS